MDTTNEYVTYRYYPEPTVHALRPNNGPVGGGTYLEVVGRNFDYLSANHSLTRCRFNRTVVEATWLSTSVLACISPKHAASA